MGTHLIAAVGEINEETKTYTLTIRNLPTVQNTKDIAQLMGVKALEALQEIMGKTPESIGVNKNVDEASREMLQELSGKEVDATTLGEFLKKAGAPAEAVDALTAILDPKDDCQCPGCIARRAHDAKLASGSKSDAKH